VERGRRIFTTETFGGNGRTCATCHRPDNDYTIDPAYIAKLPPRDPLFVAEFDPALRGLDRPKLLRRLALVTVHADGFDKPEVARAVPHLLGLGRSIAVEPFSLVPPGQDADLAAATGWSGDGAPGSGSLREFATGAVAEHLPRTLARRPGVDFRSPTADELDALEAFLLSLGRRDEIDISDATGTRFASPLVERGRVLFNSEVSGSCAFCHGNGGALGEGGFNGTFDTGVERQPGAPARRIDPTLGGDGGFGSSPAIRLGDRTGLGDGRFNTPPAIEAADTAPLFHDNSAATIEAAVRFYTTPAFADSLEGQALPTVDLARADVVAIAALLRVLNAMENIRNGDALLRQATRQAVQARSRVRRTGERRHPGRGRSVERGPTPAPPRVRRLARASARAPARGGAPGSAGDARRAPATRVASPGRARGLMLR
jgi:cytochrome c553